MLKSECFELSKLLTFPVCCYVAAIEVWYSDIAAYTMHRRPKDVVSGCENVVGR